MGATTAHHEHVGDALYERRLAVPLSREELAVRARCSAHSIALFEGGYSPRRSRTLPRVLAALDAAEAEAAKAR